MQYGLGPKCNTKLVEASNVITVLKFNKEPKCKNGVPPKCNINKLPNKDTIGEENFRFIARTIYANWPYKLFFSLHIAGDIFNAVLMFCFYN